MSVKKPRISAFAKWRRFGWALISPRAWFHMLKRFNYYNYAHVLPLQQIAGSRDCQVSPMATFAHGERIRLGPGVVVGEGCRIWAGPATGSITIGADTRIGPNVLITAASYEYRKGSPLSGESMLEDNVVIGRDVWIGAGAAVLMGSRIGEGAVIGANSVVRGVLPAGVVAAGAPARRIGDRYPEGDRRRETVSRDGI